MPSLGADMETGILIEWEKNVGDTVKRGDIIAVVETQKGAIEIEVYESGVLESQLVEVGKAVPVGTPLALIEPQAASRKKQLDQGSQSSEITTDEQATSASKSYSTDSITTPTHEPEPKAHSAPSAITKQPPAGVENRVLITPAARKRAIELGIDVKQLKGSGPGNAIELKDVESAVSDERTTVDKSDSRSETRPAASTVTDNSTEDTVGTDTAEKMASMRSAISAAMTRSKREIPHYYLSHTIDLSVASHWLEAFNRDREASERVLMGVLFLKAVALACVKYPEFNGHYENGVFTRSPSVHAGMAINLRGGGLVAPAIHDTDKLDIDTLMSRLRDLIMRVRAGRFRAAELSDSTITVSSLGERGVNSLYGVIYPPQVCLVGFGSPVSRPWVDNSGGLAVRKTIDVTLAADHRVSDGHRGTLFLSAIQKTLESPEGL